MLFLACFCIVLRELRRENCYMGNRNGEAGVCMSTLNSSNTTVQGTAKLLLISFINPTTQNSLINCKQFKTLIFPYDRW